MILYLLKRLLGILPVLGVLLTLTFFLLRLAPGGPFDSDRVWPIEVQKNIEARYGLDRPILEQYGLWISGVLQGDLRESFQYLGRPVTEMIGEALPTSILLGSLALSLSLLLGVLSGVVSAGLKWKRHGLGDEIFQLITTAGLCLPSYLVAGLLILAFSFQLQWLPPALWEGPEFWILPVLTLSARPTALISRLVRSQLVQSQNEDYVRTALGKGLSEFQVLFRHSLRNSLIPVLSLLGPLAAQLVTGSFLVEIVFQIPGLGKHFVQAVLNRDYPLVMGVTLVYGIFLLASHIGVDLLYRWADPRIQLEGTPPT